jgi:hypothetical protein
MCRPTIIGCASPATLLPRPPLERQRRTIRRGGSQQTLAVAAGRDGRDSRVPWVEAIPSAHPACEPLCACLPTCFADGSYSVGCFALNRRRPLAKFSPSRAPWVAFGQAGENEQEKGDKVGRSLHWGWLMIAAQRLASHFGHQDPEMGFERRRGHLYRLHRRCEPLPARQCERQAARHPGNRTVLSGKAPELFGLS